MGLAAVLEGTENLAHWGLNPDSADISHKIRIQTKNDRWTSSNSGH